MIQRIQTIWLLLAAICAFLTLKFPFYSGSTADIAHVELNGQFNILLLLLTAIVGTLAAVCIFLFRNRVVQMRLAVVGLVLQFGCIALYFNAISKFTNGNFALWSVFSFLVGIFFVMAIAAISKDQKLVKSMDRLR